MATIETTHRVYHDAQDPYHIEIAEDEDGLGMVMISYVGDGEKKVSVRFDPSCVDLIATAIRDIAKSLTERDAKE